MALRALAPWRELATPSPPCRVQGERRCRRAHARLLWQRLLALSPSRPTTDSWYIAAGRKTDTSPPSAGATCHHGSMMEGRLGQGAGEKRKTKNN